MGRAQAQCRLKRTAPAVQLFELHNRETGDDRLGFSGVATCKSPLCPLCAPAIMRRRADEITQAINVWGAERVWFATLTVRHNREMNLAIQQRLLTNAWGRMFSGRAGQLLAAELGGPIVRTLPPPGLPETELGEPRAQKPHTVRAHDRTWSDRHNWHPHLHVLMFMHSASLTEPAVFDLLRRRWKVCVVKALRAMKDVVHKAMCSGLEPSHPAYVEPSAKLRARCEKTLGKKLFKPQRTLVESARFLQKRLETFSANSLIPKPGQDGRLLQVELVRQPGRVSMYLAKLGLELTGMGGKRGKIVVEHGREVEHFGLWQLAAVACTHGHELRQRARGAWTDLFYASFGTQTLTFSQGARAAFGLDDRPDADIEQDVPEPLEDQRLLGWIASDDWKRLSREQRHGLLASLYNAHHMGFLELLPYVRTDCLPPTAFMGRAVEHKPQSPAPQASELEQRGRARAKAPPAPVPPEERLPSWYELDRWEREHWQDELREKLHDEGITSPRRAAAVEGKAGPDPPEDATGPP